MDCDSNTANSDYGGQGPLVFIVGTTYQFTHKWTGTYDTPPTCAATDTATPPIKLNVSTALTSLVITGTNTDTVDYTCQPLITHN